MTLSEAVQKYKNRGNSRDRALRRAKERIEKAGESWTPTKQQIFDEVWTGKTVVDVPARVSRTTKVPKVVTIRPTKPVTVKHPPVTAPLPVKDDVLKLSGTVTQKQPDTQIETGTLGQLQKEYARMTQTTSINTATVFYTKLWHYFIQKHWGSGTSKLLMEVPTFRFLKDMGKRFGVRAHYMPSKNQLSFSRRLFYANFEDFCNTFQHEMCHQAVHLIDVPKGFQYKVKGQKRDIHGEAWKSWMRHCGLTPQRCDMLDNTNYMNEDEKKEVVEKKELKEKEHQDKKKLWPQENIPAQYYSPDKKRWYVGMIVCPNDKQGKRWVFINQTWGTNYMVVPNDWFCEIDEKDKVALSNSQWINHAKELGDKIMGRKSQKAELKQMKKLFRSGRW